MDFDGATFNQEKDGERLKTQLDRVFDLMFDGQWRTLAVIASRCGGTEASISARLRDLRKEKFGGFRVERKRSEGTSGLWLYRVLIGESNGREEKAAA